MNPEVIEKIKAARSVLIALAKSAKRDSYAAGIGLYLSLIQEGKTVHLCCEGDANQAAGFPGADALSKALRLGGNVLKVTFPYKEGAIDKVTYNITDDKFNLLIEPRQGEAPLSSDDVQYSYTGGSVDCIVVIDAPALEQLGSMYLDNPDIFTREKIINIDRRFDNKQYGEINIVEKQASSTSELILQILGGLRIQLNQDAATVLYAGIVAATNNFTSFSTNAQTLDSAGQLLKAGARKVAAPRPSMNPMGMQPMGGVRPPMYGGSGMPFNPPMGQPPSPMPFDDFDDDMGAFGEDVPLQPVQPQQPTVPTPQPVVMPQSVPAPQSQQPPVDWLKPKIFKSSDTVK